MRLDTTGGSSRVRWPAIPLVILALVMVSWVLFEAFGLVNFDEIVDRLAEADKTSSAGLIFALLVVDTLVPVPSTPLMILAGTIFGAPGGVALSVAGSMASSAIAYAIGRLATPRLLRKVIGSDELQEMQQWGSRFGRWVFVMARGVPMMAETVGVSAGIGRVPFALFLRYTLLGTFPICLLYGVAGSYAETVEEIVLIAALGFLLALVLSYAFRRSLRRHGDSTDDSPS